MPESAECRIQVNQLNYLINKQNLKKIEIVGGKFLKTGITGINNVNFPLTGTIFSSHGKFIYATFDQPCILAINLAMTGSFKLKQSKHSALKLYFDTDILFDDIRHFGNFKFISANDLNKKIKTLGWNPLDEDYTPDVLNLFTKFQNKGIADVLLGQRVISGTGAYLIAESLYRARLHPMRLVRDCSNLEQLCKIIQDLIKSALADGGASIATYADIFGKRGNFSSKFKIYRRHTDEFGNQVSRVITKSDRSIYYVNELQK